jgi:hypothetical protein
VKEERCNACPGWSRVGRVLAAPCVYALRPPAAREGGRCGAARVRPPWPRPDARRTRHCGAGARAAPPRWARHGPAKTRPKATRSGTPHAAAATPGEAGRLVGPWTPKAAPDARVAAVGVRHRGGTEGEPTRTATRHAAGPAKHPACRRGGAGGRGPEAGDFDGVGGRVLLFQHGFSVML